MKICIISGSHRKKSQSEKVSQYFSKTLSAKSNISTHLINLAENPIPLFDEEFFDSNNQKWQKIWKPISEELKASDGVVIVSPEWHGMVPAGLKNFLLFCGTTKELAHKAGLIVSVSVSTGGAYPINEIRTSGYKNSRICFIPEHIIVRDCANVLNKETTENQSDEFIRNRIAYAQDIFIEYSKALRLVRESGKIDHKTHPNGMS